MTTGEQVGPGTATPTVLLLVVVGSESHETAACILFLLPLTVLFQMGSESRNLHSHFGRSQVIHSQVLSSEDSLIQIVRRFSLIKQALRKEIRMDCVHDIFIFSSLRGNQF